ncbi:MAG: hypothetical protein KBT03_07680 [Bacteroidales bacterium]|nr:hypothetical protein [Candidatus Scybalousia scybalohippi]
MKTFDYYDITCALTHNIDTCERCKRCGDDCMKIRLEMVEYVKTLHKALDKFDKDWKVHLLESEKQ